jgi:hypothetical protein
MSRKKLNDEQVHEICKLLLLGEKKKDIGELYGVPYTVISKICYKVAYRSIASQYNLETIWKPHYWASVTKYSDTFIDFIFKCIKNEINIDDILLDERCEIHDKNKLIRYISRIKCGRLYRSKLIENDMYNDDINNQINNIIDPNTIINITNDIKKNPKISTKELAKKYNITSHGTISDIRTGSSFSDITDIKENEYTLKINIDNDTAINIANDIKANPKISNKELSDRYDVTPEVVSYIRTGHTFSDITGFKKDEYKLVQKIDNDIVIAIANDIKANPKISTKELAKKYNTVPSNISYIRCGRCHSKITGIKKDQYKLK